MLRVVFIVFSVYLSSALAKDVLITDSLKSIPAIHDGETVVVQRNQDRSANIIKYYQSTWRGKLQPLHPFKPLPVETLAELEVLDYIEKIYKGDNSILLVDSRPQSSINLTGIIPSAIRVNSTMIYAKNKRDETLLRFGVTNNDGVYNFDQAKTLVLYCNGAWCGKSPKMIRKLISMGYPPEKLKYYRGGMQAWQLHGLSVVK